MSKQDDFFFYLCRRKWFSYNIWHQFTYKVISIKLVFIPSSKLILQKFRKKYKIHKMYYDNPCFLHLCWSRVTICLHSSSHLAVLSKFLCSDSDGYSWIQAVIAATNQNAFWKKHTTKKHRIIFNFCGHILCFQLAVYIFRHEVKWMPSAHWPKMISL